MSLQLLRATLNSLQNVSHFLCRHLTHLTFDFFLGSKPRLLAREPC